MPDLGVEQQVERDALLGAAPVQAERLAVAAHQAHLLVRGDPAQRAAALGDQDETGVAGEVARDRRGRCAPPRRGDRPRCRARRVSAIPVQPLSTASSARYSSAIRPTEEALTRIGRSLLTRTTSRPSAARLRATARMRVSLSPSWKPFGSTEVSLWLSSTRRVPPCSPTGIGSSRRPCCTRRSSSRRRALRAKYPSSGCDRLASSSTTTTTGTTTSCSANRNRACGSDSSTEVSSTYVRISAVVDDGRRRALGTRASRESRPGGRGPDDCDRKPAARPPPANTPTAS